MGRWPMAADASGALLSVAAARDAAWVAALAALTTVRAPALALAARTS
jgi:hypothetical protein